MPATGIRTSSSLISGAPRPRRGRSRRGRAGSGCGRGSGRGAGCGRRARRSRRRCWPPPCCRSPCWRSPCWRSPCWRSPCWRSGCWRSRCWRSPCWRSAAGGRPARGRPAGGRPRSPRSAPRLAGPGRGPARSSPARSRERSPGRGLARRRRGGRRGGRRGPAVLALLDGLDQLALAHPRRAADPELGREALQLGEHHAGEAGGLAGGALAGGLGRALVRRRPLAPAPSGDAATGSRTSVLSDTDWSFLIDEGAAGARPRSFRWCYRCGAGVPVRRAGAASRRDGRLGGVARVSAVVVSAVPGTGEVSRRSTRPRAGSPCVRKPLGRWRLVRCGA